MASQRISELLEATDPAPTYAMAAIPPNGGETRRVSFRNAVKAGVLNIPSGTIQPDKINFEAGSINGSWIQTGTIGADPLIDNSVTAIKLANDSSCRVNPITTNEVIDVDDGHFVGQFLLNKDTRLEENSLRVWDGNSWLAIRADQSINTIQGSTRDTPFRITTTRTSNTVRLGFQWPEGLQDKSVLITGLSGNTPQFRKLHPDDLPKAGITQQGIVSVNGGGLGIDSFGNRIHIDNSIDGYTNEYAVNHSLVSFNEYGLITGGRPLRHADLPFATNEVAGAVKPDAPDTDIAGQPIHPDLAIQGGSGIIKHNNDLVPVQERNLSGSPIKCDRYGHIKEVRTLRAADIPEIPAGKITTGELLPSVIGSHSITATKFQDNSIVKIAVLTNGEPPTIEDYQIDFQGQFLFDRVNNDLYVSTINRDRWVPVSLITGHITLAGYYNAATGLLDTITPEGQSMKLKSDDITDAFVNGQQLPASNDVDDNTYVIVTTGTDEYTSGDASDPLSRYDDQPILPPDYLVSNGAAGWQLVKNSDTFTSVQSIEVQMGVANAGYYGVNSTVADAFSAVINNIESKSSNTVENFNILDKTKSLNIFHHNRTVSNYNTYTGDKSTLKIQETAENSSNGGVILYFPQRDSLTSEGQLEDGSGTRTGIILTTESDEQIRPRNILNNSLSNTQISSLAINKITRSEADIANGTPALVDGQFIQPTLVDGNWVANWSENIKVVGTANFDWQDLDDESSAQRVNIYKKKTGNDFVDTALDVKGMTRIKGELNLINKSNDHAHFASLQYEADDESRYYDLPTGNVDPISGNSRYKVAAINQSNKWEAMQYTEFVDISNDIAENSDADNELQIDFSKGNNLEIDIETPLILPNPVGTSLKNGQTGVIKFNLKASATPTYDLTFGTYYHGMNEERPELTPVSSTNAKTDLFAYLIYDVVEDDGAGKIALVPINDLIPLGS